MPVKHEEPGNEGAGVVHKGFKGGRTGCGFDTNDHPNHWKNTSERINCEKRGCKD